MWTQHWCRCLVSHKPAKCNCSPCLFGTPVSQRTRCSSQTAVKAVKKDPGVRGWRGRVSVSCSHNSQRMPPDVRFGDEEAAAFRHCFFHQRAFCVRYINPLTYGSTFTQLSLYLWSDNVWNMWHNRICWDRLTRRVRCAAPPPAQWKLVPLFLLWLSGMPLFKGIFKFSRWFYRHKVSLFPLFETVTQPAMPAHTHTLTHRFSW